MKITKHKVELIQGGRTVDWSFYGSKKEAVRRETSGNYITRKYTGAVEIDLYCCNCDKDLKPGDKYLKVGEEERYCGDCYEEHTVTYYSVGGEHVGDDNDAEVYDEWDKEGESAE